MQVDNLINTARRAWNTNPVGSGEVKFNYLGAEYESRMTDFKILVLRKGEVVAEGWLS